MLEEQLNLTHDQSEKVTPQHQPIYSKPKTSLFLKSATEIQSGADRVLESQGGGGTGYLTS